MVNNTSLDTQSRVTTGTVELDALLEGGFPARRAILLAGDSGAGKTVFALRFVAAGIAKGEPAVYVSLDQKPQHLLEDVRRLSGGLDAAESDGRLTVLDASPYFTASRNKNRTLPIDARNVATDLSQQVAKVKATRLVIDSLTSLVPPDLARGAAQDYLRSLLLAFEDNLGCTVLLTSRTTTADPQGIGETAEYLVSGVLHLRVLMSENSYRRTLYVKKMRNTHVDPTEIPFLIRA
jgi:circadian clock protein KaiC